MKQTVTKHDFIQSFRAYDRFDQFGYNALEALFEHYEDYEESTGEEVELDVIAICCDWTYYTSAAEAAIDMLSEYETDDDMDEDEREESALDELRENTTVLDVKGGGYLVLNF